MKKQHSQLFYLIVFIFAQLALFSLLGLWIFRYVNNRIIIVDAGNQVSTRVMAEGVDIIILVCGCILFAAIYLGMILIFRNLNIQLRIARLYDNFISNITHELKSPLASIRLYLDTMDNRDIPRLKQKAFFGMMKRDTDRLTRLVDSVLEIASLEQKKLKFDSQVYGDESELINVFEEARQQFSLSADAVEVHGHITSGFAADLNWLKTVFGNLFDNAIKYAIEPVKIRIFLKNNSKRITIEFSDNGIGIAPDDQKKVFDKFHRIYNSRIPNVKGTGLGLYLVKEIIRHHNGKIDLISDGENTGTTVRIMLPVLRTTKKRYFGKQLTIVKPVTQQKEEDHE